jgi:hypothetical protein
MKPLIHFAHANGVPSKVYQKLFDLLSDQYDVIYVPLLGPDRSYPIDNHWKSLTPQVVEWICTQTIQHTDQGVLYRNTLMHEPIQFCKF